MPLCLSLRSQTVTLFGKLAISNRRFHLEQTLVRPGSFLTHVVMRLEPVRRNFWNAFRIRGLVSVSRLSRMRHKGDLGKKYSMERCDAYRHFAVQCVDLARRMDTSQDRSVLLEMALLWSRLAEYAAKSVLSKEPHEAA